MKISIVCSKMRQLCSKRLTILEFMTFYEIKKSPVLNDNRIWFEIDNDITRLVLDQ